MEITPFYAAFKLSLDKDLFDLLYYGDASAKEVMDLQMLRLARGRAMSIPLTVTGLEGWSADGVNWVPSEPGTYKDKDMK